MVAYEKNFWKDRKVLVTGHTGFKGAWLCSILKSRGAHVFGMSKNYLEGKNLFAELEQCLSIEFDFLDINFYTQIEAAVDEIKPEFIFHLAAQSEVLEAFSNPLETLQTNIIGTANIFQIFKNNINTKVLVNITSDKCYEPQVDGRLLNENDPIGASDIYSTSKACSELIHKSYEYSYLAGMPNKRSASVRAGNVIGGGDWAPNRIVPDIMRHVFEGERLELRNPQSVRPWQHVLEPLSGYIKLAEALHGSEDYCGHWNFSPNPDSHLTVSNLIKIIEDELGKKLSFTVKSNEVSENPVLKLDGSKAENELNHIPRMDFAETIRLTTRWYNDYYSGVPASACVSQDIEYYFG